ncbi:MAG: molybdopterin-synthase adenylyltransferase MoeB [Methanosarcinaceae archaeon]|nr:molybdopterin-synthase adenylyltransferase MoeB [Methanosarcinaceae archaeon]
MTAKLSDKQRSRYSKHLLLQDIGETGQQRLLSSKVLCIGAGGLGSPVIQYLAAAGIGEIGIVDDDRVEMSNLQRQVIHGGKPGLAKVISALEFVERLNPDVIVHAYDERISADNISMIDEYDMVVDCSDNFMTRYLVNDACVLHNKPLAHGSIFMFEGQVMTILPHVGPCYRCLFRDVPSKDVSCDEGVLGVLPGVIGVIQATEVIKHLLGIGETLVGRMVYYDALNMKFDEITVRRDPQCPMCGLHPEITSIDRRSYQD